jgi:hypothetical protein
MAWRKCWTTALLSMRVHEEACFVRQSLEQYQRKEGVDSDARVFKDVLVKESFYCGATCRGTTNGSNWGE